MVVDLNIVGLVIHVVHSANSRRSWLLVTGIYAGQDSNVVLMGSTVFHRHLAEDGGTGILSTCSALNPTRSHGMEVV